MMVGTTENQVASCSRQSSQKRCTENRGQTITEPPETSGAIRVTQSPLMWK